MNKNELILYTQLLSDIKQRVRQSQHRTVLSANAEMIAMYWDVGRMIDNRQKAEGWGTGVIPRLANDLKNELPELKGFSERNIKRMLRFYREYPLMQQATAIVPQPAALLSDAADNGTEIVPQPAALLSSPEILLGIPWFHHVVLFEKIKDIPTRMWYARHTIEQGWSRDVLTAQIKSQAHQRQGAAITNFGDKLPAMHVQLATSRFAVVATKWWQVIAMKWRQVVATGASPWFVPQPRFSVPKGRHERVLEQGSCRPFGTHRRGVVWSTGLRPWLHPAVPLGLNRIHSKPKACSAAMCTEAHQ
ncbi:MAG: DUF1016 N-terminal domain-containing protein [Planctomycetota bacterium]|nr:DUF1016 N-terminal domain-containing protein [Planctomycetota bacterium]